jgi:serine/threonine protein kinase
MSMSCLAGGTPARGAAPPCALSSTEGAHYQLGPVIASPTSLPSTVQLARQANRLRAVVAKRYSLEAPVREGEEDPMQYIRHEVASMRQFHHPNILPCLAAFSCGTEVWLVTPLMPHGSLADLTKV